MLQQLQHFFRFLQLPKEFFGLILLVQLIDLSIHVQQRLLILQPR